MTQTPTPMLYQSMATQQHQISVEEWKVQKKTMLKENKIKFGASDVSELACFYQNEWELLLEDASQVIHFNDTYFQNAMVEFANKFQEQVALTDKRARIQEQHVAELQANAYKEQIKRLESDLIIAKRLFKRSAPFDYEDWYQDGTTVSTSQCKGDLPHAGTNHDATTI